MRTPDKNFPYDNQLLCYLFISTHGDVKQIGSDIDKQTAFDNATANNGRIIAIWPGKWRSDAFNIDPHEYGLYFGCIKEDTPFTILGYTHIVDRWDTCQSTYVTFYLDSTYDSVHKIPNFTNRFAEELEKQFGWTIAKSKGSSGGFKSINPETGKHAGSIKLSVYVKPCTTYRWDEHIQTIWGNVPDSDIQEAYSFNEYLHKNHS